MKALVLREVGKLELCEVPVPDPRPDELLIRTCAATICTSDLQDIRYNHFGVRLPMIMGHEGAGIVEAVGSNVKNYAPGDKVASHPVVPCGHCFSCRRGLNHLCGDMEHLGIDLGGVFAEFYTIRADRVRRIPPGLSFAAASLMEPVCVCLEAIERAQVPPDGAVLIIGDGPFGILTARLLRGAGAKRVIMTGRHPFRMELAGCESVNDKACRDVPKEILKMTGGEGVDSAILCAGTDSAVQIGIAALRPRGTLSVFSAVQPAPMVDLFRVHVKELQIHGSCNDKGYLDRAVAMLADPALGIEELVTHRLPFDRWQEAFHLAEYGKDEAAKVSMLFEDGGEAL